MFHVRDGRIRGQRGWVVEKVEDVTDAELVEHLLQQVYGGGGRRRRRAGAGSRPSRARCSCRCCRPTSSRCRRGSPGCAAPGRRARAAARRQAGARRDRPPQRRARARAAPHPPRRRPHDPQPGAAGDPGGARPAVGAAADRVLRRLAQPGHLPVGVDGRLRGRSAAQERVPARSRSAARRARAPRDDTAAMHEVHHAPVPALPRGPRVGRATTSSSARGDGRATARAAAVGSRIDEVDRASPRGSRTRRTSSSSTAARRRSPPRQRAMAELGHRRRRARAGWPSGSRRCGCRGRSTR